MTFRPMLAAKPSSFEALADLRYPLLASFKLDGIRAIMRNGVLMSRSMKPIPNRAIQEFFGGKPEYENLDGELIMGQHDQDVYRRTMSAVMSVHGDPMDNLVWTIFDQVGPDPFKDRLAKIRGTLGPYMDLLKHYIVHKDQEVMELHEHAVSIGFEGLILRDIGGFYKQGRSTMREQGMVKVKAFNDSEALIVGFKLLRHNENPAEASEIGLTKRSSHKDNMVVDDSRLGALEVEDLHTGVRFDVGTGFTDSQRMALGDYTVGKIIKYSYFPGGVKDKPRFPVFLGFREEIDL